MNYYVFFYFKSKILSQALVVKPSITRNALPFKMKFNDNQLNFKINIKYRIKKIA